MKLEIITIMHKRVKKLKKVNENGLLLSIKRQLIRYITRQSIPESNSRIGPITTLVHNQFASIQLVSYRGFHFFGNFLIGNSFFLLLGWGKLKFKFR